MPGPGRTIFIAGAGIAGLTLALALAKFGLRVVVLEQAAALSEFGAGLQVSPNARRVLDALGLDEAIAARSLEPEGIDVFAANGARPVVRLELGAAARGRFGKPYAVMHRADLADLLFRACRRFANIEIVFGVTRIAAEAAGDGVTVRFEAPDGNGRSGPGFALVGADGVHSVTRTSLLGGPAAQYAGRLAWRALVEADSASGLLAMDRTTLLLAPGHHLVAYPLPHRSVVNLALFLPEAEAGRMPEAPVLGRGADRRVRELVERAAGGWTAWSLYSVETGKWHEGAVGLVGDAAHAMLPFQAQGAAMAIEDAAVLAPLLASAPDAASAFSRHAALRRGRVERVAAVSRSNGRIFHMGRPLSLARDAVMRLEGKHGHFRRLGWLYDHDATAEAEPAAARGG